MTDKREFMLCLERESLHLQGNIDTGENVQLRQLCLMITGGLRGVAGLEQERKGRRQTALVDPCRDRRGPLLVEGATDDSRPRRVVE